MSFGDLLGKRDFKAGTEHVPAAFVGSEQGGGGFGIQERAGVSDDDLDGVTGFCQHSLQRDLAGFILKVVGGGDQQIDNGISEFFTIGGTGGKAVIQLCGAADVSFCKERFELFKGGGGNRVQVTRLEVEGIRFCVFDEIELEFFEAPERGLLELPGLSDTVDLVRFESQVDDLGTAGEDLEDVFDQMGQVSDGGPGLNQALGSDFVGRF